MDPLHHPDHLHLVSQLHELPHIPTINDVYQYPILGKIFSQHNKDAAAPIGALIDILPVHLQKYVQDFVSWGKTFLNAFLDNLAYPLFERLRAFPIERLLLEAQLVYTDSPKEGIKPLIRLLSALIEALDVYATFKNWLSNVISLLEYARKNLASVIKKIIEWVTPYLANLFTYLFTNQRLVGQQAISDFLLMFNSFKANYRLMVIDKGQPEWLLADLNLRLPINTPLLLPRALNVARKTFYYTDILCFYGYFTQVRDTTWFRRIIQELLHEWAKLGSAMVNDAQMGDSEIPHDQPLSTTLSLFADYATQQALLLQYQENRLSYYDLIEKTLFKYALDSAVNLKTVLQNLYVWSFDMLKISAVADGALEAKDVDTPVTDLTSLIDLERLFPQFKSINNPVLVKKLIKTMAHEIDVADYGRTLPEFNGTSIGLIMTAIYDKRHGRRHALHLLNIEEDYAKAIATIAKAPSYVSKTFSEPPAKIGDETTMVASTSSFTPPTSVRTYFSSSFEEFSQVMSEISTLERDVLVQLEEYVNHPPLVTERVTFLKEPLPDAASDEAIREHLIDHTMTDPEGAAEHLYREFLYRADRPSDRFFLIDDDVYTFAHDIIKQTNNYVSFVRTTEELSKIYAVLNRVLTLVNALLYQQVIMADELFSAEMQQSKYRFYDNYKAALVNYYKAQCYNNDDLKTILLHTETSVNPSLDSSTFIKHHTEIMCTAFSARLVEFLDTRVKKLAGALRTLSFSINNRTKISVVPTRSSDAIYLNFLKQANKIFLFDQHYILETLQQQIEKNKRFQVDLYKSAAQVIYQTAILKNRLHFARQDAKKFYLIVGGAALAVCVLFWYQYMYTVDQPDFAQPTMTIKETVEAVTKLDLPNNIESIKYSVINNEKILADQLTAKETLQSIENFMKVVVDVTNKDANNMYKPLASEYLIAKTQVGGLSVFTQIKYYARVLNEHIDKLDTAIISQHLKPNLAATGWVGGYGAINEDTLTGYVNGAKDVLEKFKNWQAISPVFKQFFGGIRSSTGEGQGANEIGIIRYVTNAMLDFFPSLTGETTLSLWKQISNAFLLSSIMAFFTTTLAHASRLLSSFMPGVPDYRRYDNRFFKTMAAWQEVLKKVSNNLPEEITNMTAQDFNTGITRFFWDVGTALFYYAVISISTVLLASVAQSAIAIASVTITTFLSAGSTLLYSIPLIGSVLGVVLGFASLGIIPALGTLFATIGVPVAFWLYRRSVNAFKSLKEFTSKYGNPKEIMNSIRGHHSELFTSISAAQIGLDQESIDKMTALSDAFLNTLNIVYENRASETDVRVDRVAQRYYPRNAVRDITENVNMLVEYFINEKETRPDVYGIVRFIEIKTNLGLELTALKDVSKYGPVGDTEDVNYFNLLVRLSKKIVDNDLQLSRMITENPKAIQFSQSLGPLE